jgi:integrase/recombinase XerD
MLDAIQELLKRGVSPISVNTYLRGFKAYIRWLHSEEHLNEVFKVPFLKTEQKILQTLPETAVHAILRFSPQCANDRRIHAFVCLLLDTGIRLSEGLALIRSDIDWENMVVKVKGKGSKYRLVPMSLEGRKILFRFANRHSRESIFSTRTGLPLSRRNAGRDMKQLSKKINITGIRFSPHTLRHTFAVNYLRRGGNLFYLSKILGHSSVTTTQKYLQSLSIEDLQAVHNKLSLLGRG